MASQPLAALDPAPGDAVLNATAGERPTTAAVIVGLVGVQPLGSLVQSSLALTEGRDSIHDGFQHLAVMYVGARQFQREGMPFASVRT